MARLLLALRYLGTRYHGWQVQPNAPTIQETVQDAVESVTGVRSGVTGCSRTDAGVHAEMYCCAFDTESRLRGREMVKALNARLPRDIAVYGCREVPETFHPRYAASGKRYVYRFWNAPERNPFWEERACQVRRPLEVERMDAAARDFLGTHDFVSCRASDPHRSGPGAEDTVRTVDCGPCPPASRKNLSWWSSPWKRTDSFTTWCGSWQEPCWIWRQVNFPGMPFPRRCPRETGSGWGLRLRQRDSP